MEEKLKLEKFKSLLKKDVEKQSLSIRSGLKQKYKKYIVEQLSIGNISLEKQGKGQSFNEYKLMRKFANILLKDILYDNQSYVMNQFSRYLDQTTIEKIKNAFSNKTDIDDDINISIDQMDELMKAIQDGLNYPIDFDYHKIVKFLNQLHRIFKWEKYEKETIGNKNMLKWYAVILNQWVQGYGLGQIIQKAIEYKKKNPKEALYLNFEKVDYEDTKEHKNSVITDTLNAIEQVVLFQLSNYFLKFSLQYKKFHNIDRIENDWYEYIEYGTNNPITIFLQKNEISRETATYIKEKKSDYLIQNETGWKISNSILTCGKSSIEREMTHVKYNMPELFVDLDLSSKRCKL